MSGRGFRRLVVAIGSGGKVRKGSLANTVLVERVLAGLMAYGPEKVILFGSYARGDFDEFSDIDLIVIKNTDQRFFQRLAEVDAFMPRDVKADVFVYTPREFQTMIESGNPFIEQALKDGIVLYEKAPGNS